MGSKIGTQQLNSNLLFENLECFSAYTVRSMPLAVSCSAVVSDSIRKA
jgi:hypothetical protein